MANNNTRRNVNVRYRYSFNDRNGTIDVVPGATAPIHVGYASNDLNSHSFAMQLQHPNYLHLNLVHINGNMDMDRHVDPSDNRPDVRVHKGAPIPTFQEHISSLANVNIHPIMLYSPTGETGYYYVPQQFRVLMRGVVDLLLYIHSRDRALTDVPLTLENLLIGHVPSTLHLKTRRNELMVCDLDFVLTTDETRDAFFKKDWDNVHRLFKEHILRDNEHIPEDMKNLLHDMSNYKRHEVHESRLINHLALMLSKDRIMFIKKCFDDVPMLFGKGLGSRYDAAVRNMGDFTGWINATFYNPNNSIFEPVKNCFEQDSGSRRFKDHNRVVANYSIIKCARIIAEHLGAHILGSHGGLLDIDIMVMATLGSAVVAIHRSLCTEGVLNFMFEN